MTFAFNLLFFPLVFLEEEVEGVTRLFRENLFQVLVLSVFFFLVSHIGFFVRDFIRRNRETEEERPREPHAHSLRHTFS